MSCHCDSSCYHEVDVPPGLLYEHEGVIVMVDCLVVDVSADTNFKAGSTTLEIRLDDGKQTIVRSVYGEVQ